MTVDMDTVRAIGVATILESKSFEAGSFHSFLMTLGFNLQIFDFTVDASKLASEIENELAATARVLRTRATMAQMADNGQSIEAMMLVLDSQVGQLREGLNDGVGAAGTDNDLRVHLERLMFPDGVPTQPERSHTDPSQWAAENVYGRYMELADADQAHVYWNLLTDEQKVAAFEFAEGAVATHYVRVGNGEPVAVRYSPQASERIEELIGWSTPRTEGDSGFNLVSEAPYWVEDAARWWLGRDFEGDAWDAPTVDGLYVQDVPYWVLATWLGPDAEVGTAEEIVARLPAASTSVDYSTDDPIPYDRWSGAGERVLPPQGDGVMALAEFFAYSTDFSTIASSVPTGLPGPEDLFLAGISLLATAYTITDWDYDPNDPVNPDNLNVELSGIPQWPPIDYSR